MKYYSTNSVYEELIKQYSGDLVWASENAWILLYADCSASVKVVTFVSGDSTRQARPSVVARLKDAENASRMLASSAKIPFASICFDDAATEIDHVYLNSHSVSLLTLKEWFSGNGLRVDSGSTGKAINSRASSAYHNWQRSNLGAIKVSDVDLIRLDNVDQHAIELIELKRSFYSLKDWEPYPEDFQNFNVVANLADRIGARFTIAYNVRTKKPPVLDDPSNLSLFDYSKNGGARSIGVRPFAHFQQGQY